MKNRFTGLILLAGGFALSGCAGSDNPTALADLEPVAEWEIETSEIETMREVEIVARVREGAGLMRLREAQVEIGSPNGPERVVALTEGEHGYEAHVRFYEPGEHHLHLMGRPERHHLMGEMGELEIEVERQHQILDDHRFELAVDPAPPVVGIPTTVHVMGWMLEPDGAVAGPATGLTLHGSLQLPNGVEVSVELVETAPGEYGAEFAFPVAGTYGVHLSLEEEEDSGAVEGGEAHGEEVEFVIHVPSLDGDVVEAPTNDGGGHGHGD